MHFQDSLPTQPIPTLEDTLGRFLSSAKPLLSESDYTATAAVVEEFKATEGPVLHQELLTMSKGQWKGSSYVSEPWFDMYLKNRAPLPININPQLTFLDDPTPGKGDQAIRAASLVSSSLRFFRTLRDEQLEPHIFHTKPKSSKTSFFNTVLSHTPKFAAFPMGYLFGVSQATHLVPGKVRQHI
jgi:carnitine O-palmitoyltransferase 2